MIYIILASGLVIVVCLFFLIRYKARLDLTKRMLSGVNAVKLGVSVCLLEKFKERYGKDTAYYLAAAVTNELFGEHPTAPNTQQFFRK